MKVKNLVNIFVEFFKTPCTRIRLDIGTLEGGKLHVVNFNFE